MINEFTKKIGLSKIFFKFLFKLRYLLIIFLLSALLFLLIPKLFDFKKDIKTIQRYLEESHKIKLLEYSDIYYKILPFPSLIITNSVSKLDNKLKKIRTKKIILQLDPRNIYRIKNLKSNKIIYKKSTIEVETNRLNYFLNYILSAKKTKFQDTLINIKEQNNNLVKLEKTNILNRDSKNIKVITEYMGQEIIISYLEHNNSNKVNFLIKSLGIKGNLLFLKNSILKNLKGNAKIAIINNNFKFDFALNKKLQISNSSFRNKNLTTSFDGFIETNPFFNFDLVMNIKNLNQEKINKKQIYKFINNSHLIKKINGKLSVKYENNKIYLNNLIKNMSLNVFAENGNISLNTSELALNGGMVSFNLDTSTISDNYKLNFEIFLDLSNTNKFLKSFLISKRKENKSLQLNLDGSINLKSNKLNINKIKVNDSYNYKKNEVDFYKEIFQEIVIKDDFLNIFDKNKIRLFLIKIK